MVILQMRKLRPRSLGGLPGFPQREGAKSRMELGSPSRRHPGCFLDFAGALEGRA